MEGSYTPRPYNWIRGEGTVRNQRWGLGSEMDTPFMPHLAGLGAMGPVFTCPDGGVVFSPSDCSTGVPLNQQPDVQQQISDLWASVFSLQTPNALSNTSSGVSPTLLLLGGGVLLLLFLKR